ncbi:MULTISPECIES: hypothetical protein [Burkholderia cepacia complex]|uniref:hypothetical protein n=1 Tax=Burkholderia cepacia complex TaxID=87882 RepID=UPI001178A87C|nr:MULTISPECIES: hypothetical protein [Burkholderia cepacia complex]MCA8447944.1 hypothetical protein [Burkholderia vietnamiensis]MDN7669640.1 hypothetical protein [Burkholderia vietnamiensis]HDR8955195.1 hypothetical protein [Burkholderia vietnamiensis]
MKRAAGIFFAIFLSSMKLGMASGQIQSLQGEETLCGGDEDIYFSCPLDNGKIVSVCAKNNTDPRHGYVKYKYGDKGDNFVFPQGNTSPNQRVEISDVSEGSIRGLHLKFSRGAYTYVVSSVWPGEVYVSKNGKIIFNKECRESRYKSFSNKIFDGINQVPPSSVDLH